MKRLGGGQERDDRRPVVPHFGWWLAVVGAAALALRIGIVFRSYNDWVAGDGYAYSAQANLMAKGHLFIDPLYGGPSALHPPAWVLVLTLVPLLGGHAWFQMQLAASAIGAATVVMSGLAGRRIAGDRAGLVAAAIAVVYAGLWIYERALLSETLLLFEIAVMIILAYRFRERPSGWLVVVLGAMCGVLASTRSEQILVLPLIVVPLVVSSRGIDWNRRIKWLVVGTLSMLVVLAPWTIYNLGRFHYLVLLSNNAGGAAVVANCNPAYYGPRIGFYDLSCEPQIVKDHPSVQERTDQQIAITYAEHHLSRLPMVVFAREGRALGFWNPFQQTALDHETQGTNAGVLDLAVISLWLMAIPAIAGVVVLRRRRIPVYPLLGFVATVVISVAATFGDTRYRAAAEVSVVLLAAVAIDAIVPSKRFAPSKGGTDGLPCSQGPPVGRDPADSTVELTPALRSPTSTSAPRLPIACLVLLALGAVVVTGVAKWTSHPPRPVTSVILPSNGTKLKGSLVLDAVSKDTSSVNRVEFLVTGGEMHDALIGTATTATAYGWLTHWNTSTVPDGSYVLQAVAFDVAGRAIHSAGVTITVEH